MSLIEPSNVSRVFGAAVSIGGEWALLDVAMKMTHMNEAIIPISSTELTFSLLISDPRIADQRGFV